ncbi:MAG TPA: hypothetical protein VMV10_16690 [Pirellulales bacterium]|nr:hypothetical protein [Pirellulales bacterium]
MTDSFDPYHKWLGIPPAEQPPNHYRLLGIGLFEADPDVIEQAADRQMTHVQTHKTGSHSAASQKLLNQLSAAKLCLLSQAEKAKYDAALRARLAPPPVAPVPSPPIPVATPPAPHNPLDRVQAAPPPFVATTPSRVGNRSKSSGPRTAVLGAIVAAVLVGGAAVYFFALGPAAKQWGQVAAKPENVATPTRAAKPAVAAPKPLVAVPPPAIETPEPAGEEPTPAAEDPASPPAPGSPEPAMPDRPAPASDTTPSSAAAPGVIDLLGRIDPARDAVSGEWRMENGALLTPADAGARLRIAFETPAEYDVALEAVRLEGQGTLGLGLLVGGSHVLAAVDAYEGTITGLDMIDSRSCNDNETTHRGGVLHDGLPNRIEYRVRPDHVQVTVNGEKLIDWHGDSQRLATSFSIPDPPGLSLVVWGAKYRITRLEATAPEIPQPKLAGPVDLLQLIDAKRDAVHGEWRREGTNLVSPNRGGWLMVPHEVPPAYLLAAEVQRLSGPDSLGFGLVIDGRLTEAVLDGWWGGISGLHLLDDLEANNERNETRRAASVLRDDFDNSIQCLVDKYGVTVRCNGKEVFDFSGDARRLSFGGGFGNTRNDRLYLGAAGTVYLFSKCTLTPLEVADRRLYDFAAGVERLSVPDDKALRDAEKQVRQLFRDRRTAAKNPSGKIALARSLLEKAAEPTEPAIRYAMFQEAIGQAAAAGDYSEAVAAILAACREFDVSPLALKRQALAQANGAVKAPGLKGPLADDALRLIAEAVLANDYETADEAGRLAAIMARASKDRRRIDQVRDRVRDLAELHREYEKGAAARERLQQAPDDAEAHRVVGEFECVWKRNWPIGMAHLGLGSDAALQHLAQDELLNARDAAAKRALAERWLALAEPLTGEARTSYQVRGIEWFHRAAAGVKEPQGGELKNKIDALARESSIADRPRRWLEQARAAFVQEAEIDGGQRVEWFNVPGEFAIDRSWSLTFEFAGAKAGSHAVLFMIGDGRAGCDPIVVSLDGDKLVARVDDSRDSLKTFSIDCRLDASRLAQWQRLRLSFRGSDRSLTLDLGGVQTAAGSVPFAPFIDRAMPIWICGESAQGQRFAGKVRMVSLTNE